MTKQDEHHQRCSSHSHNSDGRLQRNHRIQDKTKKLNDDNDEYNIKEKETNKCVSIVEEERDAMLSCSNYHDLQPPLRRAVDWDFPFSSLWSICGRRNDGKGSRKWGDRWDEQSARQQESDFSSIALNIPETVLFRDGLPFKWVCTEEGKVVRKPVDPKIGALLFRPDPKQRKDTFSRHDESVVQTQMHRIIQSFSRFCATTNGENSNQYQNDMPVCTAWFSDGTKENLSEVQLAELASHRQWRFQLIGLQEYVHPRRLGFGVFSKDKKRREKYLKAYCNGGREHSVAFDAMTKTVSLWSERAYCTDPSRCADGKMQPRKEMLRSLTVVDLVAGFVVDASSKLWFSHIEEGFVQYRSNTSVPTTQKYEEGAAITEAQKVGDKLKKLLRLAFYRKVSTQKCFSHFDPRGTGYVDVDGLCIGLSGLGMNISTEGAEILMEMIGRASGLHFRSKDLAAFAMQDVESVEKEDGKGVCLGTNLELSPILQGSEEHSLAREVWRGREKVDVENERDLQTEEFNSPTKQNQKCCQLDKANSSESTDAKKAFLDAELPSHAREFSKQALVELNEVSNKDSFLDQVSKIKTNKSAQTSSEKTSCSSVMGKEYVNMCPSKSKNKRMNRISINNIETQDSADHIFLTRDNFSMTYRILTPDAKAQSTNGSCMLREKKGYKRSTRILMRQDTLSSDSPSDVIPELIIVPDILMPLDSLECIRSSLNPGSSALLIGLPGFPGTSWPDDSALNNTAHSKCISELLKHLLSSKKWPGDDNSQLCFLGFGIGSAALLHFVTHELGKPEWENFKSRAMKGITILSNSYASISKISKEKLSEIKCCLLSKRGSYIEQIHGLASFLFSKNYIMKQDSMSNIKMLCSRWSIVAPDHDLEKSSPHQHENVIRRDNILALIEGMERCVDISSQITKNELPLLLIQSTDDSLIDPSDIPSLFHSLGFEICSTPLELCNRPNAIHVSWLKAGHHFFSEQQAYFLDLLGILMRNMQVRKFDGNGAALSDKDVVAQKEHATGTDINRTSQSLPTDEIISDTTDCTTGSMNDNKNVLKVSSHKVTNNSNEMLLTKSQPAHLDAALDPKQHQNIAQEDDNHQRQIELEELRKKNGKAKEESMRLEEIHHMRQEDKRSLAVRRFMEECKRWKIVSEEGRQSAEALRKTTEEEEGREIELSAALLKAEKREAIRLRSDAILQKLAGISIKEFANRVKHMRELLNSSVLSESGDIIDECLDELQEDCKLCRKAFNDSIQQQCLAVEKLDIFQKECESVGAEVRRVGRAFRLLETQTSLIGGTPSEAELFAMKHDYDQKQTNLSALRSVLGKKEEVVDNCNREVQGKRLNLDQKQSIMHQFKIFLTKVGERKKQDMLRLRQEKERMVRIAGTYSNNIDEAREKKNALDAEYETIDNKEKHIDTQMWQGTLQRIPIQDFLMYWQREKYRWDQTHKDNLLCLRSVRASLTDTENCMSQLILEQKEIARLLKKMDEGVPSMEHPQNSQNNKSDTEEDPAALLRNKPDEIMTEEEKQWTNLDYAVNSSLYSTKFSDTVCASPYPENELGLKKADVERIMCLSEQLQHAIPFLKSENELKAHNLLNTFSKKRGDVISNIHKLFSKKTVAILNKRLRRDKIRSLPIEEQTTDQRNWLKIDRILDPSWFRENGRCETATDQNDLSKVGDSDWIPPFDEKTLRVLAEHREADMNTEDEVYAWNLMSMFYIREDEVALASSPKIIFLEQVTRKESASAFNKKDVPYNDRYESLAKNILYSPVPKMLAATAADDSNAKESFTRDTIVQCKGGCIVMDTIADLALLNENNDSSNIFVASSSIITLLEVESKFIGRSQSTSHHFMLQNGLKVNLLSLEVSIIYQGSFEGVNYSPGRISASFGRIADGKSANDTEWILPEPLGFAPHSRQTINTSKNLGRLVIVFDPGVIIDPGLYEITVHAESNSKYSISVTGTVCYYAKDVLQREISNFFTRRALIAQFSDEISTLWTNMRIAERKLSVLETLQKEAEMESNRCEADIEDCDNQLEGKDELTDKEFDEINRDIKVLEMEFAHWCRLHSIRTQESDDTKNSIRHMSDLRAKRYSRIQQEKKEVERTRDILPLAIAPIFSAEKAMELASMMNSNMSVDEMTEPEEIRNIKKKIALRTLTPAEKVRRLCRQEGGLGSLTLEEKQFASIDMALNPDKWEWISEREDIGKEEGCKKSEKRAKKREDTSSFSQFHLKKVEIERIQNTSLAQVRGKDKLVKKILLKFHDNASRVNDSSWIEEETFDPLLAARTRSKQPKMRSLVDQEWITVDRILNPDAWTGRTALFETHHSNTFDAHSKIANDKSKKGQHKQVKKPLGRWVCPFDRNEILQIWSTKSGAPMTSDEERCQSLLLKYNGEFDDYIKMEKKMNAQKENVEKSHGVKWSVNLPTSNNTSISSRCRIILNELDKVVHCRNDFIESSVLHVIPQRFPTHVLRLELERELDRLIREQIFEHEARHPILFENDSDSDDDYFSQTAKDGAIKSKDETVCVEERVIKRTSTIVETEKTERQRLLDKKAAGDKLRVKEIGLLGFGGCLACKNNPCLMTDVIDITALEKRKEELSNEILYVQKKASLSVIESAVARSSIMGGDIHFRKEDLIYELQSEIKEIDIELRLNAIDKELHDAYATRHQFIEVQALHGYSTLLTAEDAVNALENEHNRVIAALTAKEVVDEILEWMLDGWYFGERDNSVVASKEYNGLTNRKQTEMPLVHNENQINAQTPQEKALSIQKDCNKRVECEQNDLENKKRMSTLDATDINLKFGLFCVTFMYFRALHAIKREKKSWAWTREDASRPGDSVKTSERQKMNEEDENARRRQMLLMEANEKANIGFERKRRRLENERAYKIRRLHFEHQKKNKGMISALMIQRHYRGHLGRKASRRWALKRAEINAMNALMNGCAIAISRIWRGYRGRVKADALRKEMAEFIVAIRTQEAQEDLDEYWKRKRKWFG